MKYDEKKWSNFNDSKKLSYVRPQQFPSATTDERIFIVI